MITLPQKLDTLGQKVVVTGDPIDGLFFYGPFPDGDTAIAFAEEEHAGQTWWIAPLRHPIEVERENAEMNGLPIPPLPPATDDLLEMLDNVSASADNMLIQFRGHMTASDKASRGKTIAEALALCDEQLRGPDKAEEEDGDEDEGDGE